MKMYEIVVLHPEMIREIFSLICEYASSNTPTRQDFMLYCYAECAQGRNVHNQMEFNAWADDAAAAWAFICESLGAPLILK